MINVKNIIKHYKINDRYEPILKINELGVTIGEQVALIGPSGCGKSTLLHIVGGVIQPDQGEVEVNGENLSKMKQSSLDQFRAQNIGYIFQDFHLIPSLTAEENVKLAMTKKNKREGAFLVEQWFDRVGLKKQMKQRPGQLSRGQQQRVAIIRALINQPAVVLADEPTGSLDFETANQMMSLLLSLCKENDQTLICVTHDRSHAESFPRVINMQTVNDVLNEGVKVG